MDKNVKVVLGVGAAAILGWILFFRKGTPGETATPSATVGLSIVSAGYSGEYGGITPLVEGTVGNQAIVTVINTSVYTGTAIKAPFTFSVGITIQIPDGTVAWSNLGTLALAAGETKTYTFTFTIPYGTPYIGTGKGRAFIANPATQVVIVEATPVNVTVTPAGVTPGGTIGF